MRTVRVLMVSLTVFVSEDIGLAQPQSGDGGDQIKTTLLGQWNGSSNYSDVWITQIGDSHYAVVGTFQNNLVNIINVTDPAAPVLAGTYRTLASTSSAQDVKIAKFKGKTYLIVVLEFSGNGDDLEIVDISDPQNPNYVTTVALTGLSAHNCFVEHKVPHCEFQPSGSAGACTAEQRPVEEEVFLYIVDSLSTTLFVVDFSAIDFQNPPARVTQAKWVIGNIGGLGGIHDVTVVNNRAYVCAWDYGLWVYDTADVRNSAPRYLGQGPGNNTHSAWPTADGRFVVAGEEKTSTSFPSELVPGGGGGIVAYAIADDGAGGVYVTETDRAELNPSEAYSVHNQFVAGYRSFSSWYEAGLQVFDIDPVYGTLQFHASYDTYAPPVGVGYQGAWGIHVDDRGYMYISDRASGLYIFGADCNDNGVDDGQDIASGGSFDCSSNGIPDECEPDCDGNGQPDSCDILSGIHTDCSGNGIPDVPLLCEPDCDGNGIVDSCDILDGRPDCTGTGLLDDLCETDCNMNLIADSCDIASGTSQDCTDNGIPDDCEPDCNMNLIADSCDIASGFSKDQNGNDVPDECDPAITVFVDDDAPGDPGPGDPTISDPNEDGSLLNPFDSIQEAIDAAADGSTIEILDGLYTGVGNRVINLGGRNLDRIKSTNGPANCIINLQVLGQGFLMVNGEQTTLEGLSILNGSNAGVLIQNGSNVTIENCLISNCINSGILAQFSTATVRNSLLEGNSTGLSGAGISGTSSDVTVVGCTVLNNKAGNFSIASGVSLTGGTSSIRSSIIRDNLPMSKPDVAVLSGTLTVTYSNIGSGYVGIGNITADPRFVDPANNNFRLRRDSPCVDAGDPSYVPVAGEVDLLGSDRISGPRVDIGADEVDAPKFVGGPPGQM